MGHRAPSGCREQEQPFPSAGELTLGIPDDFIRELHDDSMQRIADRLHLIFTAATPTECAELVNKILTTTGVHPMVAVIDGRVGAGWAVDDLRNAPATAAALTLREHLGKHGFSRLGICIGRNCADVYIDASPTRDRRYCSVTCQTRARVAAFRSSRARNATT
ncbi:CGNR zinc finger domain-containing protein [Streptomyces sp. 900116325]